MATSLRTALTDARASAIPHTQGHPSAPGVWALGRIEARRMLLHPSFLIATAFGLFLIRGLAGTMGGGFDLAETLAWLVGGALIGVFVGTVLTANVAALRQHRDHTQELFGALPAPPESRTASVFVGLLLGPVAFSVVLTVMASWAFRINDDMAASMDLFLAVQVPLTVFALGAIGIAVGRWVPTLLGGPVVIALHVFTGVIWAVPWIQDTGSGIDRPRHMLYLVAAITMWTALAFARDRRTPVRFAIAAAAFVLGVVMAIQQAPLGGY
ncbi:MAG TPA: hypothetical protein VI341_10530 [Actinomycetota bacterium]